MFNIKDTDLARELGISLERLYQIVDFFDSDSKDEWELVEGVDFKFTTKKRDVRVFSYEGAFAITKYLDSIEKKNIFKRIKNWVTQKNEKIMAKQIENNVLEVLKSDKGIVSHNSRTFFSKEVTKNLLKTSYPRLHKSFIDIQRSDSPLAKGEDYDDIEGKFYYSSSGFVITANEMGNSLTCKNRKEWCKGNAVLFPNIQKRLQSAQEAKANRIKKACELARKRDKSTCQLTGEKPDRTNRFNLASHHLFSKAHYPNLAESVDNIITIKEEIHQEFHNYMGGYNIACTIDDFIKFTIERYPDADLLKLSNIKSKLVGR